MHVGIIGAGYVGLVTGACFAEFGVFVTCGDKDQAKIRSLEKGEIPFYEPGLEELVKRNIQQDRLVFTRKIEKVVRSSLVLFIAVGTPRRGDGAADMQHVESVAKEIARYMDGYKVIVTKSTVPVGTGERIRKIISENQREHVDFDIVSNPEFLREGSAIEDFMRPNRVVLGARNQQAVAIMQDLYKPLYLIETPFIVTDVETAELIKYASNSFLATKISFVNELANLCEKVGADIHVVAKGMGLDRRIGPKFLHPGPGYGGSCLPKDTNALLRIAEEHGIDLKVVSAAVIANEQQKEIMIRKIRSELGTLKGKTIAMLGISFKPNTDDVREAPSLYIMQTLLKDGAKIRAYDPAVKNRDVLAKNASSLQFTSRGIRLCKDAYDAAKGADALVLVTEWNQFRNLDLARIRKLLKNPCFFDLRNVYDPEKLKAEGFQYSCVGRV